MPKTFAFVLIAATVLFLLAPLAPIQADEGETKTAEKKKEDTGAAPPKAELGKKVANFTVKDVEGRPFTLHASKITRKDAEAAVRKAAQAFGAPKDAGAKTVIDTLRGVKDEDGDLDDDLKVDFACAAGAHFGLIATCDTIGRFKTLGDLTNWIAGAADAPLLLVVWSPNCPSVKKQNDKLIDLVAKTGARLFVLGANTRDTNEHYAEYRDNFDFKVRIFPDRDQKVTDILGGKVTPHHFLIDKDAVLRYRGAIDNDPMGYMDDDEREDLLEDAIQAIKTGKPIETKESDPAG